MIPRPLALGLALVLSVATLPLAGCNLLEGMPNDVADRNDKERTLRRGHAPDATDLPPGLSSDFPAPAPAPVAGGK